MSCTLRREENLNDYLDEVLDAAGREETQAHLVVCPSCRTTCHELEKLALRARELPGAMAPPSDLWPGLRRRIEAEKRVAPRPMPRWGLAMAAVLLMAGVIIGAMMGGGLSGGGSPTSAPSGFAPVAGSVAAAHDPLASLRAAEVDFQNATQALLAAMEANRANLPSTTAGTVDANLELIRLAIGQVWVALEADPDNSVNAYRLVGLYRAQISMLERTARVRKRVRGGGRTSL
jgi:anti-sigma factor RsiW